MSSGDRRSLQLESLEGKGIILVIYATLAVTESHEVRRELRVALVFAIILSALGGYRAGKAIKKMKAADP